jgi:hypothetical protein
VSKIKITIEKDEDKEVFEVDEYWLFTQDDKGKDSIFQHRYQASKLFRSHVQSHVTLENLAEHLEKLEDNKKDGDE